MLTRKFITIIDESPQQSRVVVERFVSDLNIGFKPGIVDKDPVFPCHFECIRLYHRILGILKCVGILFGELPVAVCGKVNAVIAFGFRNVILLLVFFTARPQKQ